MKILRSLLPFFLFVLMLACNSKKAEQYPAWTTYKGSPESLNYSSLRQIDTTNVRDLQVAWEYHTGDADTVHSSQIQCNPIVIDGTLFGTSAQMKLFAIDAASGKQKWIFDPFAAQDKANTMFFILNNNRGVTYWSDGKNDKRIFYTAGSHLYCLNAEDGKLVQGFGATGKIDLHDGLGRDVKDLFITSTSPGIIYRDLIIMGSRVDEGAIAAPGHIRAYDVRTGEQKWIFHTIPQPGQEGFDSWEDPEAYKYIGGANAWSGFSLDEKRGIVYASTGSASYDFYGGKRKGANLFADCLLALDAATGKRRWHFQQIHHDLWDRDLSSPPALVTIERDGKKIDAAALTTKTGFIFVFNRETGEPLYPISEKPVPTVSDLEGEAVFPTQPFPERPAPFMRQAFTEQDINPLLSPEEQSEIRERLKGYKSDHIYNPPSLQGTVVFPGLDGGGEWGGPSFDPETGVLYVNSNEMAWVIQAIAVKAAETSQETYEKAGKRLYENHCMSCHGADRKGSGNFPALTDMGKKYSRGGFDSVVVSGRRMMPAFKQLNENEREAIMSYVMNDKELLQKKFEDKSMATPDYYKLPYTITGYNKFLTSSGLPAIAPPWGTLNAINLSTGEYLWKVPLGHDEAFPDTNGPTGTENYGGGVVTAGGVLFIGATKDGKFRAFNKKTGKLLWERTLPAAAYATPAVYELNGKQYVVIACGGGKMKTRSGDSYVAFALPD